MSHGSIFYLYQHANSNVLNGIGIANGDSKLQINIEKYMSAVCNNTYVMVSTIIAIIVSIRFEYCTVT